jgi:hypothetical protein
VAHRDNRLEIRKLKNEGAPADRSDAPERKLSNALSMREAQQRDIDRWSSRETTGQRIGVAPATQSGSNVGNPVTLKHLNHGY